MGKRNALSASSGTMRTQGAVSEKVFVVRYGAAYKGLTQDETCRVGSFLVRMFVRESLVTLIGTSRFSRIVLVCLE